MKNLKKVLGSVRKPSSEIQERRSHTTPPEQKDRRFSEREDLRRLVCDDVRTCGHRTASSSYGATGGESLR